MQKSMHSLGVGASSGSRWFPLATQFSTRVREAGEAAYREGYSILPTGTGPSDGQTTGVDSWRSVGLMENASFSMWRYQPSKSTGDLLAASGWFKLRTTTMVW